MLCRQYSPAQFSSHATTVRAARAYSKAPLQNLPVPVKVTAPNPIAVEYLPVHEASWDLRCLQVIRVPARPGKSHQSISS